MKKPAQSTMTTAIRPKARIEVSLRQYGSRQLAELSVGRINGEERERRCGTTEKVGDQIDPDVRQRREPHDGDADGDGRIERAARHRSHRIRTGKDGEANRQSVG